MKTRVLIIVAIVSGFGLLAVASYSFYGTANFLGIGLPYTEHGYIDFENIGYTASLNDFRTKLYEKDVLYNTDDLVLIQGMSLESYPPITDYCGYVIAEDDDDDYWYQSVFKNSKLGNNQITEENPMPCIPNMNSCICSLEQEIAARFGTELLYFDEGEEKRVAEIVRREFETNVANVPSEFEMVVGKYNFDFGEKYRVLWQDKLWS
ncbi:MAG: hypothetical protein GKS07_09130 [Nitrosopumilus sp.]|nr:MAG: hypothetical protein GKS07_09130 [Nitrosopumilus sp.]